MKPNNTAHITELRCSLSSRSLNYFLENAHPITGLVRDRAKNFGTTPQNFRMASMAATGFGLAILANAADRGLISPRKAEEQITRTLRFAQTLEHHRGWFYHFVDWGTGNRFEKSEISTIDTTLFMAGALYAAEVFPRSESSRIANSLYERLDFSDMMTNGGTEPNKRVISHGWTPEKGYIRQNWDSYSELMLLIMLGLGHPRNPLPPECWTAWTRPQNVLPEGQALIGAELSLFAHQYSHLFIDFRSAVDQDGTNYFENSKMATLHNRETCRHLAYPTYQEGLWGLSACDSPGSGYSAYSPANQDGTVCLGAAAASIMFCPDVVQGDLRKWMSSPYRSQILGKYGFADSVNLGKNWFDSDILGITAGPVYLALANLDRKHSVWSKFNRIPAIRRGLSRAGLRPKPPCHDLQLGVGDWERAQAPEAGPVSVPGSAIGKLRERCEDIFHQRRRND